MEKLKNIIKNKMKKTVSLLFLSLIIVLITGCNMPNKNTTLNETNTKSRYTYGEEVKYEEGKVLEFLDFALKYTGESTSIMSFEENPEHTFLTSALQHPIS